MVPSPFENVLIVERISKHLSVEDLKTMRLLSSVSRDGVRKEMKQRCAVDLRCDRSVIHSMSEGHFDLFSEVKFGADFVENGGEAFLLQYGHQVSSVYVSAASSEMNQDFSRAFNNLLLTWRLRLKKLDVSPLLTFTLHPGLTLPCVKNFVGSICREQSQQELVSSCGELESIHLKCPSWNCRCLQILGTMAFSKVKKVEADRLWVDNTNIGGFWDDDSSITTIEELQIQRVYTGWPPGNVDTRLQKLLSKQNNLRKLHLGLTGHILPRRLTISHALSTTIPLLNLSQIELTVEKGAGVIAEGIDFVSSFPVLQSLSLREVSDPNIRPSVFGTFFDSSSTLIRHPHSSLQKLTLAGAMLRFASLCNLGSCFTGLQLLSLQCGVCNDDENLDSLFRSFTESTLRELSIALSAETLTIGDAVVPSLERLELVIGPRRGRLTLPEPRWVTGMRGLGSLTLDGLEMEDAADVFRLAGLFTSMRTFKLRNCSHIFNLDVIDGERWIDTEQQN